MFDLIHYLKKFSFLYVPLLSCYINLRTLIIFCLSSGDIYFSLGISVSCSFIVLSKLFCSKLIETFVILLAILLPTKLPVVSAFFELLFLKKF